MVEFESVLIEHFSDVWGYCLLVPKALGNKFIEQNNRRVVCLLNSSVEFQCALMPNGNGEFFINVNKEIRSKLKLKSGDRVTVNLSKDKSKCGLPMPVEFEQAMELDELAQKHFNSLTPGKQRNLLFIVGKPKSSEIRIKKALVILEHLKIQNGKIDFKALNEEFKKSNNERTLR